MKHPYEQAKQYAHRYAPPSMRGISEQSYYDGFVEGGVAKKNRSLFWFCLGVALTLLLSMCGKVAYGQDSVKLTVTKARSTTDKTYYWLKDDDKNKYYTVCDCKQQHNKGDIVTIAKKDMEFIPGKIKLK